MVSNSFSAGEEGAKPLTSLKKDTEFGTSQSFFGMFKDCIATIGRATPGLAKSPAAALAFLHGW